MPPVVLPTDIVEGDAGHIGHHNALHENYTDWVFTDGTRMWLPDDFLKSGEVVDPDLLGTGHVSGESTRFLREDGIWVDIPGGGVTDHGALTGLTDDDHAQYLDLARHNSLDHSPAMGSVVLDDLGDISPGPGATGARIGDTIQYGFGWRMVASPLPSVEVWGAECDLRQGVGATTTMTSGSNTITLVAGLDTFDATQIGNVIVVPGAGAAGIDLVTTITGVTSGTIATTLANAGTTVNNVKGVIWGTNDVTLVQGALDALPGLFGGTVFIAGRTLCNGELNVQGRFGVRITGRVGSAGRSFTSASGFWNTLPPSCLVYVKSGTATFLNAAETKGFLLDNCAVLYANAQYTGTLISLRGNASDSDLRTVRPQLSNCTIGGCRDGLVSAAKLVDDTRAWRPLYAFGTTVGGDIQFMCDNGSYVNGRNFFGWNWGLYGTVAIRNPGEGMFISGGQAERGWAAGVADRVGALIDCGDGTTDLDGMTVEGTWFSDVNNAAAASSWIKLAPGTTGFGGVKIAPSRGGGGSNQTLVEIVGDGLTGLKIDSGSHQHNGTLLKTNNHTGITGEINTRTMALGTGITIIEGNADGIAVLPDSVVALLSSQVHR